MRRTAAIGVLVCVLLLVGRWYAQTDVELPTATPLFDVVIAPDVFLRAGPSETYPPVGNLRAGDFLFPVSRNEAGDWVLVAYFRGSYGWIRRDLGFWVEDIDALPVILETALTPTVPPGSQTSTPFFPTATPNGNWVRSISDVAYVRAGPGRGYLRLGQLFNGDQVTPIARNADTSWIMIQWNPPIIGNNTPPPDEFAWIATNLVDWADSVDLDGLPLVAEDNLTPSPTFTPSNTPTVTPSATATATVTSTATFTATATMTATPIWTATPTQTSTPTPSATDTQTATSTPTPTVTSTATATVAPPTETVVVPPTVTNTEIPTLTPTETPTSTPTATSSATDMPTATLTATVTATWTLTPTASFTPTATVTVTWTPTWTVTPSDTPTATWTVTPSHTPTAAPTATPTWTHTATFTVTPSETLTPTSTPTLTDVPTETPTNTPVLVEPEPTIIPTLTPSEAVAAALPDTQTPTPTPLPPTPTIVPSEVLTEETETIPTDESVVGLATETLAPNAVAAAPTFPPPNSVGNDGGSDGAIQPSDDGSSGTPPEIWIAGGLIALVLGYAGLYLRGALIADRYRDGFVIDHCPVCEQGTLSVETRVGRVVGVPSLKQRMVRCDNCRSVLREVGSQRWRYAVDPLDNEEMYRQLNNQTLTERDLERLARQGGQVSTTQVSPEFVDDDGDNLS